ncbi:hypothetical protein A2U01_0005879 [Trifolium medium]|uniref:Uncharacterized protein n=1 Tax=Trifolium medium TaxID=97028 RepID=A0A392ME41_9FABA|nr:hypothetical protein [Trifolium medium]
MDGGDVVELKCRCGQRSSPSDGLRLQAICQGLIEGGECCDAMHIEAPTDFITLTKAQLKEDLHRDCATIHTME